MPGSDRGSRPRRGAVGEATALAGAGVQFAVIVAACTAGGWWLDDWLGTSPWLLLAGALFGAVAAFYHLYRLLVDATSHEDGETKASPRAGDEEKEGR